MDRFGGWLWVSKQVGATGELPRGIRFGVGGKTWEVLALQTPGILWVQAIKGVVFLGPATSLRGIGSRQQRAARVGTSLRGFGSSKQRGCKGKG